jgi:hypothetical protein
LLKTTSFNDLSQFPFPTQFSKENLIAAEETIQNIGTILTSKCQMAEIGRLVGSFLFRQDFQFF